MHLPRKRRCHRVFNYLNYNLKLHLTICLYVYFIQFILLFLLFRKALNCFKLFCVNSWPSEIILLRIFMSKNINNFITFYYILDNYSLLYRSNGQLILPQKGMEALFVYIAFRTVCTTSKLDTSQTAVIILRMRSELLFSSFTLYVT